MPKERVIIRQMKETWQRVRYPYTNEQHLTQVSLCPWHDTHVNVLHDCILQLTSLRDQLTAQT